MMMRCGWSARSSPSQAPPGPIGMNRPYSDSPSSISSSVKPCSRSSSSSGSSSTSTMTLARCRCSSSGRLSMTSATIRPKRFIDMRFIGGYDITLATDTSPTRKRGFVSPWQDTPMPTNPPDVNQVIPELRPSLEGLFQEVEKVIVGQRTMLERLLIGLLTGGHVLLEGVPGLAKTLTVSTLAQALRLSFSRIQFTPDLLPADVIGTQIYNPRSGEFTIKKGPIFANLVLADEINRAPAKVQSALLEAMQEKQVTIGDRSHTLEQPFLVLATQNPIEQEGTYQLPEAQLDRFMLKLKLTYPTAEEEQAILQRMAAVEPIHYVEPVLAASDIFALRKAVDQIYMDDK